MSQPCTVLRRLTFTATCAALLGVAVAAGWTRAGARPNQASLPKSKPATPSASAGSAGKKSEWAHISAERWTHDDVTSVGSGRNFRYVEGETTVTGDAFRYNSKQKQLDAEGHLVLDDLKHHVTGDKATVDNSRKKLAIITGHVVLVLKPESEAQGSPPPGAVKGAVGLAPIEVPGKTPPPTEEKEDAGAIRRHGVTATCDRLEDYYRRKFAILRGNVVFTQKYTDKDGKQIERTATAEHAEYNGKTEVLVLFAPVEMHDNQGQEFHFDQNLTIHTKKGEEQISSQGKLQGKIHVDEEDEGGEEEGEAPSAPATPTPSQPAPPSPTGKGG